MAERARESSAEESEWAGIEESASGGDDDMDFEVRSCVSLGGGGAAFWGWGRRALMRRGKYLRINHDALLCCADFLVFLACEFDTRRRRR